jgi:hypothetical protein
MQSYPCPRHEGALRVYVELHAFLTSALDGGMFSPSHPGRFTWGGGGTRHRYPMNEWVGPIDGLDAKEERQTFHSYCSPIQGC